MGLCKLCLNEKKLVESHIIPKSFYDTDNFLITAEDAYSKRRPIGTYDKNILCEDCECFLNKEYDNDAKKILIDKKYTIKNSVSEDGKVISFYQLEKDQYEQIEKFFISVLWRASISTHPDFSEFSLGPYEEKAKNAILNSLYPYSQWFSVALMCFKDFKKIQLFPMIKNRIEGVNFYTIIIGSVKAFIKVDKRKPSELFEHMSLANKNILMFEGTLKSSKEYQSLLSLARKHQSLKNKRQQRSNIAGSVKC